MMKAFLICCLWGQGWIGAHVFGAIAWHRSFVAERAGRKVSV